jgi:hypothetical protein
MRAGPWLVDRLGPVRNQHRNPIHDRIHSPTVPANQLTRFKTKASQTSWACQLVQHRRVKLNGMVSVARHRY